jgi:hypothetical protein
MHVGFLKLKHKGTENTGKAVIPNGVRNLVVRGKYSSLHSE